MPTMFDALLELGKLLKSGQYGIATGGSTTTLLDSLHLEEPTDWFNDGTLFFVTGNNANTTAVITDYIASRGEFHFSALPHAVAAGDQYVALRGIYPRSEMVMGINLALDDLGPLPITLIFTPTLTNQESYTLPIGVSDLRRVEYTNNASIPYDWQISRHWQEISGDLIFDTKFVPDATKFRLWYEANHAAVEDDEDTISTGVSLLRVGWDAAYYCALQRLQRTELNEPFTSEFVQLAVSMRSQMAMRFPVKHIPRDMRAGRW